ncbi:MAG: HAD family hydrolase [Breznakia sp.]
MIKLAVFDVDGTLLAKGWQSFSKKTLFMLETLRSNGIKLAIASGRPPFFVKGCLDTEFVFDYYICVNGAYVVDRDFNEINRKEISLVDVENLIADFVKYDDAMMFQFDDAAYCYNGNKRITHMLEHWIGRLNVLVDHRSFRNRHVKNLPLGVVCNIDPDHIAYYQKQYPHLAFDAFSENFYDIHIKDHSKADGIQMIANVCKMGMDEIIAFGDNYNDIQMLQAVGIGVAMGNAMEEVKAIADYISKNVEEDGAYYACQYFQLL